MEEEIMNNGE